MFMKLTALVSGIIFFAVAGCGLACWGLGHAFWAKLLLHGGTVYLDRACTITISGRLLSVLSIFVPLVSAAIGVLLFLSVRGDES
jgi:hypothetical protein